MQLEKQKSSAVEKWLPRLEKPRGQKKNWQRVLNNRTNPDQQPKKTNLSMFACGMAWQRPIGNSYFPALFSANFAGRIWLKLFWSVLEKMLIFFWKVVHTDGCVFVVWRKTVSIRNRSLHLELAAEKLCLTFPIFVFGLGCFLEGTGATFFASVVVFCVNVKIALTSSGCVCGCYDFCCDLADL